jgi:hypothetical protein
MPQAVCGPHAGILEGVIHSYGQNYPCSFPTSHFTDVRDPHVRVFFNLSPGEREREEGGSLWPAGHGRAPILAAGGLRRLRDPPVAGSSGQPTTGEL